MIIRIAIYERKQFVTSSGIYDLVDARETKGVFRAMFVEISVINAHSPFFILFLNKNRVC